jgi:phospholipase/lecithinase/hemolysin
MVVFGDSLSDIGNLYAISGSSFPPDPPYWQGRVSNGPVWVEQLAERLNLESTTENNYAVAGAMTGDGNFNERPYRLNTDLPGLADEITQFVGSLNGPVDPDALYVVWAGANNFFDPANLTPEQVQQAIMETIAAVSTLRYYGAEHILLGNLPDLGLTPDGRDSGMGGPLTYFSIQYNQALQAALTAYGLDVIYFDSFTSFNAVVDNPSIYGLSNVTAACFDGAQVCGNPDEYLFWDGVHPTTRGHQVLAEIVFQQLASLAPLNNADWATVNIAVSDVSTPVAFVNDNLYVGGTNQNDRILIMPQRSGGVSVNVNGISLGPYQLETGARMVAFAHDGNDFLWATAASQAVILDGGAGNDLLFGGWAGDILRGDTGNDFLFGGQGADTLLGNSGHDVLFGGRGNDLLLGGHDDDLLFGGQGNDTLFGEAGNDYLFGGIGEDELNGGEGLDWLFGELGLDRLVEGEWDFIR